MARWLAFPVAWWQQRPVRVASVGVAVATVASLGACAWRVRADGSVVAVSELAQGHRHLLVPLIVMVVVTSALAGSAAARDTASGQVAVLATTSRSVRRGVLAQLIAAVLASAAWLAVMGVVVCIAAVVMVAAVGGGPAPGASALGLIVVLLARAVLTVIGVTSVSVALGFWLPGSAIPAAVPSIGVLAAEAAALVATGGKVDVLLGGSYAVALVGPAQLARSGHASGAAVVASVAWLVCPVVALLATAAVGRWRPLPS